MTLNKYFFSLGAATLLSWLAFIMVVLKLNPYGDYHVSLTFILFYLTLFVSLVGSFTIVLALIHSIREGGRWLYSHISIAFRQGILLAILFIILLALQGLGMLSWWEGFLVAGGLACLEFLFFSKHY